MKRVALGFLLISGAYASSEIDFPMVFSKPSYSISSIYTSNMKHFESPENFSNLNISATISSKFKSKYPISLTVFGTQTMGNQQEFLLGNTTISYSDSFYYGINRSHSLILPTSENSRENTSLRGTLSNKFTKSYSLYENDNLKVTSTFIGGFVFNSHEYKTSILGTSAVNYGFSQGASFNFSLKNFSLSAFFGAYQNYTYQSNLAESYAMAQTLIVPAGEIQLSFTHSIGGSLMAPNGEDLGVQLFDSESSNLSFGLSTSF